MLTRWNSLLSVMSVLSVVRANPKEPALQPCLKPSREWITATTMPERERTMSRVALVVEEVQEAEERDQRCALKEPLEELCTGGVLECMFDVQLEHDVLRDCFEDKLREAAGGEAAVGAANAKLKPVLGERLRDCLVARDHAAADSKFGHDGASRDWPAAVVSFGKGNKPAGQHAVSRTRRQRIVADKADEFLDCLATSVIVHEHRHEFSRPSPDVRRGAVRDGPRGFLEGAVRELQASGSARRNRRELEPGCHYSRDAPGPGSLS